MPKVPGLSINESKYQMPHDRIGKIAVFMYLGSSDPKKILDRAISEYVGNEAYNELIESSLDNPWMRVIISDINGMEQADFDPDVHGINK